MRALVMSPDCPTGLTLAEVNEPQPLANEALVCAHATSLNRGELRLVTIRPEGWIPGQDIAGVVERAAADGSGNQAVDAVGATLGHDAQLGRRGDVGVDVADREAIAEHEQRAVGQALHDGFDRGAFAEHGAARANGFADDGSTALVSSGQVR